MPRIRVVLSEMPRLLRDIVQNVLADRPDVVLETARAGTLAESLAASQADVAIVAEPAPNAEDHAAVLYAHPRLRVVGISGDGRCAHLYELRPHRISLGELSADALVRVVRAGHSAASPGAE